MTGTEVKRYSDLVCLDTWDLRFKYLYIPTRIGYNTFGKQRNLNQEFYRSPEWKKARRDVILRDKGCDLGIPGLEIIGGVYVHHMNPITVDDLINRPEYCLDPEYLITVSFDTHNKIEFGLSPDSFDYKERKPNDTCPWLVTANGQ